MFINAEPTYVGGIDPYKLGNFPNVLIDWINGGQLVSLKYLAVMIRHATPESAPTLSTGEALLEDLIIATTIENSKLETLSFICQDELVSGKENTGPGKMIQSSMAEDSENMNDVESRVKFPKYFIRALFDFVTGFDASMELERGTLTFTPRRYLVEGPRCNSPMQVVLQTATFGPRSGTTGKVFLKNHKSERVLDKDIYSFPTARPETLHQEPMTLGGLTLTLDGFEQLFSTPAPRGEYYMI